MDQRIPGPVSCRCLEPGWFVGDPYPLALDSIIIIILLLYYKNQATVINLKGIVETKLADIHSCIRHGYEAASASASQSRSILGQSFGFGFGFSFMVSKTQSFGFGFSLVTWEKLRLQLRLRNLTNPKFLIWFCWLKTWKTQHVTLHTVIPE